MYKESKEIKNKIKNWETEQRREMEKLNKKKVKEMVKKSKDREMEKRE